MWLWANVHGTFALGFVYLGLHVAGRWLDGAPPWSGRERVLVAGGGSGRWRWCLVNPYGPAPRCSSRSSSSAGATSSGRSPNGAHRTSTRSRASCSPVWAAVFLACLALGRRRLSRRDLVVTVPFLLLAVWAQRNIALAPLVGVAAAARRVAPAVPRRRQIRR